MHNHYVSRKSWSFWKEAISLLSRKISFFRDFLFSIKRPFRKTSKRLDLARAMREAFEADGQAGGKFPLSKRGNHFRRPDMRPFLNVLFVGLIINLSVPAMAAKKSVATEDASASEASALPVPKEKRVKKSFEENLPDPDLEEEAKVKGNQQMLEGRVSGAGYNGLAVELSSPRKGQPSEIWFDYVKGVKFSGIQSLSEIQEGDTVSVSYKEGDDGRKFLKEIKFIRKKPVEPEGIMVSTEEIAEEE